MLREMIKQHEGLRLKPYQCSAGRWTIGWGHNLEAHGKPNPESISLEEAEKLLDQDITNAVKQCENYLPYFNTLSEARKAVLIDMCFNLGIHGLIQFRKMFENINHGMFTSAAGEMLNSKWATQVGNRANRLSNMMAYDKWPEDIL